MSIVNCSSQDADALDFISDTEFTLRLKTSLQQVVGFSLFEAIIPFTWYPVQEFIIKWTMTTEADMGEDLFVREGFYTVETLAAYINNLLDPNYGPPNPIKCTYDTEKDRFVFHNNTDHIIHILFSLMSAVAKNTLCRFLDTEIPITKNDTHNVN